jgi:hypothetical protein
MNKQQKLNELLATIQELSLENMVDALKKHNTSGEAAPPALLKQALDALKHNNITCAKVPGGRLEQIEAQLPSQDDEDYMDDNDFSNVIPLRG